MVDLIAQSKQDINHGEKQFSEHNFNFFGNIFGRTLPLHPVSVLPNRSPEQGRHGVSNRNRVEFSLHHNHPHHTNMWQIYPDSWCQKISHNWISNWWSRKHIVRVPALRGESHIVPDLVHLDTGLDCDW